MPGINEPPVVEMMDNATIPKPRILSCASPVPGHTVPVLRVTEALCQRGYDVTMIAGEDYVDTIKGYGARPVVVEPMMTEFNMASRMKVPAGPERLAYDMTIFFIKPTKVRMEVLYETLEMMHEEDPESEIVIVTETFYLGTHPMFLGAPLPKGFTKRPRVVNLHALCYMIQSVDTAPVGMGLGPATTDEERAEYARHWENAMRDWAPLLDMDEKNMRSLGAVNYKREMLWDLWSTSHDITLQMCPPSLEYSRRDWHPTVQFIGALPARPPKQNFVYPDFWDKVTNGEKRLVVISQGTIATEYSQLLIPSLKALANRDDINVVAILGVKGATLSDDVEVPANAHIVDYLSYDAILPHSSCFIFNAGYGGFIHGAINGVPMVMAGMSEEKPEVAARGEYCGNAVNLRTATPTQSQIVDAVHHVLSEPSFKKVAAKIKADNDSMDAMNAVESAILKMAAMGGA